MGLSASALVLTRSCELKRLSDDEVDAKCGTDDGTGDGTMNADNGEGELDCADVPGAGAGADTDVVSAGEVPVPGAGALRRGNF
jgi:hypothetical protein